MCPCTHGKGVARIACKWISDSPSYLSGSMRGAEGLGGKGEDAPPLGSFARKFRFLGQEAAFVAVDRIRRVSGADRLVTSE